MRLVLQTVEKAKIPNFLIVAIDTQLRDYLTERGVNVFYKDIQARPTWHPLGTVSLLRGCRTLSAKALSCQ